MRGSRHEICDWKITHAGLRDDYIYTLLRRRAKNERGRRRVRILYCTQYTHTIYIYYIHSCRGRSIKNALCDILSRNDALSPVWYYILENIQLIAERINCEIINNLNFNVIILKYCCNPYRLGINAIIILQIIFNYTKNKMLDSEQMIERNHGHAEKSDTSDISLL